FPCTKSEWYKQQIEESEVEGFQGSFWAPIKQKDMPQKEENFCAQLQNALKSTVFAVCSMLSNQTRALEVIFAFDEARALLEPHDTLNGNNLFYYLIMA
ncbi:11398_t:CDS:1, partial [Paraglomus brasilianum]